MGFDIWQDLRYGIRKLSHDLGFTILAVLILAVGIGINTTLFSIVDAVLFQPIAARNPEQIAAIFSSTNSQSLYGSSSYLDYIDILDNSTDVFSSVAAYTIAPADLKLGDRTHHITAGLITASYFPLLGADAQLGRVFLPEEDRSLDPRDVAILSSRLWRNNFSADPAIIGKSLRMNNRTFTIVGVVDERFSRLRRLFDIDIFIPSTAGETNVASRQSRQFFMLGRLKPGVSLERAQAKLKLAALNLSRQDPRAWSDERGRPGTITVVSERDSRVPPQARFGADAFGFFVVLMGAAVLLICCANLASLTLARMLTRENEIAVRVAVGASRWRLVRQLLAESFLLSAAGAIAAVLITAWSTRLLSAYHPSVGVSLGLDFQVDYRVLSFGILTAFLTTVLFGLTPALHATRPLGRGRGSSRFRNLLIVAEVAISILLLMPAGLFVRSLKNFDHLDLGFRRDHLVLVSVTSEKSEWAEILERVRRIPGVADADLALTVPLSGVSNTDSFRDGGSEREARTADTNVVGPRYFQTLGIPILEGKGFDAVPAGAPVAVVNEAFVKLYWPGQDATGKRLFSARRPSKPVEIIGVVKTGKYNDVEETPTPVVYLPLGQEFDPTMIIHARTAVPPAGMTNTIVRAIQEYNEGLSVFDAKTMDDELALTVAPYETLASVLGGFGGLAVILAFAGLYGLIAYDTIRRTREIGIRMALGAQPRDILSMLVKRGLWLVLAGALIGGIASLGVAKLISGFLFQVKPGDALTCLVVVFFMLAVAVAAMIIPALRGARRDPIEALRTL
jgi:predicted permease